MTLTGSTASWQTNDLALAAATYDVDIIASFGSTPTTSLQIVLSINLAKCVETLSLTAPTD